MPGEPYADLPRAHDALITDRVLQAAKPLEERLREKVAVLDAELRSRVACELLGPLRDVSPKIWALVVLAERVEQAENRMAACQAIETFNTHVSQLLLTDEGKADLVLALAALGKLQRAPR